MSEAAALTVLETTALLLTLLLIAVQYASRQVARDRVPEETLAGAMNAVVHASFLLVVAATTATIHLTELTGDRLTAVTLIATLLAFLSIGVAIRNAATALQQEMDADRTSRLNTADEQVSLEAFDR